MRNPMSSMLTKQSSFNQLAGIVSQLKNGNPEAIAQKMLNDNPNFRAFMEQNKGKTPEQVAQENGIDLNSIRKLL